MCREVSLLRGQFNLVPARIEQLQPFAEILQPDAADGENARVEYPLIKPYGANRAFAGEVTMLMDNNTFSAGTCFAAMFKDWNMGTIVGQQSGNLANFHADGLMKMGMSGGQLVLQVSNSYLVRPNGDETPAAVQPDVPLADDVDALDYALELIGGRNLPAAARK